MKEQMTYVAIDADNVGESIGNAVLSNDTDQLSSISNNINSGVSIFSQWAEYNGGKIISSGSDEAIFQVPVASIDELEDLKQKYQEKTGFSISIGIGENISEAAKALIYAKINGKDQITDYSPEIETAMKQAISGNLSEEVSDDDQLEGGVGDDVDEEELPQDELEAGTEHEKEHTDDEEVAEEIATDHLAEDDDYYSDLEEMEAEDEAEDEETEEIEVPADEVDGDYGSEEMEEGQPEHEKEMSEEEEFVHDAQENREDETDDDLVEADKEEEYPELVEETAKIAEEDEALEEDEYEDGYEDVDLDGEPDMVEEHGQIDPEEDDLDGDGDVEHEEAMAAESGEEEEYDDSGDYGDEVLEDDEGLEQAIAQEMGADEAPVEESGEEQPLDHDDLKNVIYESLNIFKENREYLNAMGQENPQLYSSLIHTLQAMIEMAKELGYGDAAEELTAEEPEMEDQEVMPEEMEVDEYQKSEVYTKLIYKMKKTFEMMKADNPKNIQEIREAIKKKKEAAKKGGNKKVFKKKNSSVKKPKVLGKKKKKTDDKGDNDGSFCAKSHKKMRAAGKDCRSNEDKNSPLCSARKKFNCRGKNEEKGKAMDKSEELSKASRVDEHFKRTDEQKVKARKQRKKGFSKKTGKFAQKGVHTKPGEFKRKEGEDKDGAVARGQAKGYARIKEQRKIKPKLPGAGESNNNGDRPEFGIRERQKQGTKKKVYTKTQNASINYGKQSGWRPNSAVDQERNEAKAKERRDKIKQDEMKQSEHIYKSEKLAKFLKKKEVPIKSGNKGRQATSTKRTTAHVSKPQHEIGAQVGLKIVQQDPETGKKIMTSMPAGGAKGPDGNILPAESSSPVKSKKPKQVKPAKVEKV